MRAPRPADAEDNLSCAFAGICTKWRVQNPLLLKEDLFEQYQAAVRELFLAPIQEHVQQRIDKINELLRRQPPEEGGRPGQVTDAVLAAALGKTSRTILRYKNEPGHNIALGDLILLLHALHLVPGEVVPRLGYEAVQRKAFARTVKEAAARLSACGGKPLPECDPEQAVVRIEEGREAEVHEVYVDAYLLVGDALEATAEIDNLVAQAFRTRAGPGGQAGPSGGTRT
jgi:hypothetical protein